MLWGSGMRFGTGARGDSMTGSGTRVGDSMYGRTGTVGELPWLMLGKLAVDLRAGELTWLNEV